MDSYEIRDLIEQYVTNECYDAREKARDEHKDLDEAVENIMDQAVDYIECDMQYLVNGWLENHGGQIEEMIEGELNDMESNTEIALEKIRTEIASIEQSMTKLLLDCHFDTDDAQEYVMAKRKEVYDLKHKANGIEEDTYPEVPNPSEQEEATAA